jgi:hypothetical protein
MTVQTSHESVDIGNGETLPVYPAETVHYLKIMTSDRIREVVSSAQWFRRYLRINLALRNVPLADILRTADDVFEAAADRVGATVVPHEWGLAPHFNHRASQYHMHPSLPEGLLLAATLESKPAITHLAGRAAYRVVTRLENFITPTRAGQAFWIDSGHEQFGKDQHGLHLLDIEPIIGLIPNE